MLLLIVISTVTIIILCVIVVVINTFSALTLLVGRGEAHLACSKIISIDCSGGDLSDYSVPISPLPTPSSLAAAKCRRLRVWWYRLIWVIPGIGC